MLQSCKLRITSIPTSPNALAWQFPFWDAKTKNVYFADVFNNLIARYSYEENKVYVATIADATFPGFIMPVDGCPNRYLIGTSNTAILAHWDGRSSTATKERDVFSIPDGLISATVSPTNDIYVGSYGTKLCSEPRRISLYEYSKYGCLESVADNFVSSVGSALDEKARIFYQLDACRKSITAFNWNHETGRLCKCFYALIEQQRADF